MVTPGNLTLTARRGDTLRLQIAIRDSETGVVIPSEGWTARMQVRDVAGAETLLLDLETGAETPGGSGLSFDADGIFEILIQPDDIDDLPAPLLAPGDTTLAYDVKMSDPAGDIETYLIGALVIATPVTQQAPPEPA
jgi:hypothetical protein